MVMEHDGESPPAQINQSLLPGSFTNNMAIAILWGSAVGTLAVSLGFAPAHWATWRTSRDPAAGRLVWFSSGACVVGWLLSCLVGWFVGCMGLLILIVVVNLPNILHTQFTSS